MLYGAIATIELGVLTERLFRSFAIPQTSGKMSHEKYNTQAAR